LSEEERVRARWRPLQREQEASPYVRGRPMTPKSFHQLIQRLGERAGMPFPIHPHILRHLRF
jgi:site-specific recombinase XerD